MELLMIGLVSALNIIIIRIKWRAERYADSTTDALIMAGFATAFKGTTSGMTVAMIASLVISLYLFIYPPELFE